MAFQNIAGDNGFGQSTTISGLACFSYVKINVILSPEDTDRIIEMAWEDRTPFDAIHTQFGLSESEVIALMRSQLRRSSFDRWRSRVHGRATKHRARREEGVERFRCTRQRTITGNKVSKR